MKRKIIIYFAVLLFNCNKFPANPIESDEDLKHPPEIEKIALDSQNNIVLYLNYRYSQESNLVVERKTIGGFNRINCVRLMNSVLIDTTFDKELDYNFSYRVMVEKNGYRTAYSEEKPFAYKSNFINAPTYLRALTLELQGIKLEWRDCSSKEDGYKIEKNSGSGFMELASLPANTQNYLDAISGIPSLPLQLSYRIKAFNSSLSSQWAETSTSYTGIGVPTNLRITDTTAYRFTIEWEDNSNIETGYAIERSKDGGLFEEKAQLLANTIRYTDYITERGVYSYRVRAKKDNLYSLYSNEVSYNIRFGVLAAPTNLRIIDTTAYHFTIEWDDNNQIETGYAIERCKDGGSFAEIGQVNANVTQYTDKITETGSYSYRVRAKKDNFYSSYSNEVSYIVKIDLPTVGLAAYYPFNGNANDESGNANHGIVYGATFAKDRFGNPSRAYQLDGVDDYIDVGNPVGNNPDIITQCIWIKTTYFSSFPDVVLITKRHDEGSDWTTLGIDNTGHVKCILDAPSYVRVARGYTNIVDDGWHLVCGVRAKDTYKVYVDSTLEGEITDNHLMNGSSNKMHIGHHGAWNAWYGGGFYFKGTIDDVRIYSRALSIDEIQALCHEGGWGN